MSGSGVTGGTAGGGTGQVNLAMALKSLQAARAQNVNSKTLVNASNRPQPPAQGMRPSTPGKGTLLDVIA
jgi:hypothetical protein